MDDAASSESGHTAEAWRQRLQNWLQPRQRTAASVDALDGHGVLPLLDWCRPAGLHPAVAAAAHAARLQLLAREALHREVLARFAGELGRVGIPALLVKGEALATTLYPDVALRPRHDIDVWVQPADCTRVEQLLEGLGGVATPGASGRWIQPERLWRLPAGRTRVGMDLHWQPTSRPALLPALPFASLYTAGRARSGTETLRTLEPQAALMFACVHRWAHHRRGSRLIWQIDVAMLWEQLPELAREQLIERACSVGVAALVGAGLDSVGEWIAVAPALRARLAAVGEREPARRLLDPALADWRFDLRFSRGRQRLQVLGDYLFPHPEWLRQRYVGARWRWLPWLYLRRLLRC